MFNQYQMKIPIPTKKSWHMVSGIWYPILVFFEFWYRHDKNPNIGTIMKSLWYLYCDIGIISPQFMLNILAWKLSRNWGKTLFVKSYIGLLKNVQYGWLYGVSNKKVTFRTLTFYRVILKKIRMFLGLYLQ